jgi:hypothetical protein
VSEKGFKAGPEAIESFGKGSVSGDVHHSILCERDVGKKERRRLGKGLGEDKRKEE